MQGHVAVGLRPPFLDNRSAVWNLEYIYSESYKRFVIIPVGTRPGGKHKRGGVPRCSRITHPA